MSDKLPTKKLAAVKWAPADDKDANKCFQIYGEYVKKNRTVTALAIEYLEKSSKIRNRIKWAAMALSDELGGGVVARQMADTALIDHIRKLDLVVADIEQVFEARREENERRQKEGEPLLPMYSVREYSQLMRERRQSLTDLARVRGVLDFGDKGTPGKNQINIIMPQGLHRGEGTAVVQEVKPEQAKELS